MVLKLWSVAVTPDPDTLTEVCRTNGRCMSYTLAVVVYATLQAQRLHTSAKV